MAITISIILLLPSISFPPLPVFELFLCSRHAVADAAAPGATAAEDDDDDNVNYEDQYVSLSTTHSLLHSEIIFCCRR